MERPILGEIAQLIERAKQYGTDRQRIPPSDYGNDADARITVVNLLAGSPPTYLVVIPVTGKKGQFQLDGDQHLIVMFSRNREGSTLDFGGMMFTARMLSPYEPAPMVQNPAGNVESEG
jgi:hypothetical protein